MSDNILITQGSGTNLSTDDVGAGLQVQRVKVQWGADGTATDTSAANPLPIDNIEFPAAAALADNLTNPTTTFVGANNLIWNTAAGQWSRQYAGSGDALSGGNIAGSAGVIYNGVSLDRIRSVAGDAQAATGIQVVSNALYNGATYDRVRSAKGDGSNVGGVGVTAVVPHFSNANNDYRAGLTASATTDANAGTNLPAAAPTLYNGATYDRQRGGTSADGNAALGLATTQPLAFNGSTWDRPRNNTEGTLLASAGRTVTTTSPNQTNYNARGVIIGLNVTAKASTTALTLSAFGVDAVSAGANNFFSQSITLLAGQAALVYVYPGASKDNTVNGVVQGVGNVQFIFPVNFTIPRTWGISIAPSDANSVTYSVSYALIV